MAAFDLNAALRSTLGSVAKEDLGEKTEALIRDIPADQINSPDKWWTVVIAALTVIPQPLRTLFMHALAAAIKAESGGKIPEIVKMVVPTVLVSVDTGLIALVDAARIDKAALRAKLVEVFRRDHPEGTASAAATTGVHKPGTTGLTARDGGIIAHVIGNTTCTIAQGSMNESGSAFEILSRPGVCRCTKCYPDAVVKITVVPPVAPAKAKTVVDILLEDKAGDGHMGVALGVFARFMELREAEITEEPRHAWHLQLMHGDGLPLESSALGLLPTLDPADVLAFNAANDALRALHDAGTAIARTDANLLTVIAMVRRFDAYIAAIRLVAERDVNDVWEWLAKFIDLIDDRITSTQRKWLIDTLRSKKPWIILGVIAALYLLVLAGSVAAGFIAWILAFGISSLTFGAGVVVFTIGFIAILTNAPFFFGWTGFWPMLMCVGWAGVVVSRLFMPLLDRAYHLGRNAIRGVLPGYEEGWFGGTIRRCANFARSKGWLPAAEVSAEPVKLAPSNFWLDTALVVSIAVSLIGILGSGAYIAYHPSFGNAVSLGVMMVIFLLLNAADTVKRLRAYLPWTEKVKDAVWAKDKAIQAVGWGIGALAISATGLIALTMVSGFITIWVGDGNVATAQQASRTGSQAIADSWYQEACEAAALCEPEHYGNQTWEGYCAKYPNASQCQVRARRASGR